MELELKFTVSCKECGKTFKAAGSNAKYCPECKEEKYYFTCQECGQRYQKSRISSRVIYCKKCCSDRRHRARPKATLFTARATNKPAGMSIDEVLKFARANHISYGEAVSKYGI